MQVTIKLILVIAKATVFISLGLQIFPAKMSVRRWQNKNKNNSKLLIYCHVHHMLSYILAYEYVAPISLKYFLKQILGNLLLSCYKLVPIFARPNYGSFSFLPPLQSPCFCCKYCEDFDLAQKWARQDRLYRGEKIKIEKHSNIYNIYI